MKARTPARGERTGGTLRTRGTGPDGERADIYRACCDHVGCTAEGPAKGTPADARSAAVAVGWSAVKVRVRLGLGETRVVRVRCPKHITTVEQGSTPSQPRTRTRNS